MRTRLPLAAWLVCVLLLLAGCGGGGGTGVADGGGVGSGGTGIMAANVTVGTVEGFGSIIVNGIRYDTDNADTSAVEDPTGLKYGMTVRVEGTVDTAAATGVARAIASAPELRGGVASVDVAGGGFVVLDQQVATNGATVFEGVANLAELTTADTVQVYGLPGESGRLLATRVEKVVPAATRLLTGAVQALDREARTLRLGGRTIDWRDAAFDAPLSAAALRNGILVRIEVVATESGGDLPAVRVRGWYAVPATDGVTLSLSGPVTGFAGLDAFQVQGVPVDASQARINGGAASSLGNGVYVEATGVLRGGVLVPERLRIRERDGDGNSGGNSSGSGGDGGTGSGTGGGTDEDRSRFSAEGRITQFEGPQRFRVQNQWVDASNPSVRFSGGTVADLARGRRVSVQGSTVRQGTLVAESVRLTGQGDD